MTDQILEQKQDAILFASRASQLLNEQKIKDALKLCEAGVRQFPFYSPGHYILGLCYEALGQDEDAKNEFERTLVYDPSHNKAMRKLSDFYRKSGLDQLSNDLLVKEALYSPLNPEIIAILKEKDLYKQLNQADGETDQMADSSLTEAEIEDKTNLPEENIQGIEEIADYEVAEESENAEEDELAIGEADGQETIDKKVDSEEEVAPIDNLDPLAGEDLAEEEDKLIDNSRDSYNEDYADQQDDLSDDEDDFSPLMQGYLDKDDLDDDDDQWMEVENLLEGEEEMSQQDLDPVPEGPKDETERLLQQLSSDEDDDINLEAAVVDPYDHIDLTSDKDNTLIGADDLLDDDLSTGIDEPSEKKKDITSDGKEEIKEEVDEDDSDTISEIVSEFEKEEENYQAQGEDVADNQDILDSAEQRDDDSTAAQQDALDDSDSLNETYRSEPEQLPESEQETSDQDEEVTISDMLENPNLVTPTFGEILIAQHKFSEARHVFVELSKKDPDNTRFMKKIQFLDKFLQAEQ